MGETNIASDAEKIKPELIPDKIAAITEFLTRKIGNNGAHPPALKEIMPKRF